MYVYVCRCKSDSGGNNEEDENIWMIMAMILMMVVVVIMMVNGDDDEISWERPFAGTLHIRAGCGHCRCILWNIFKPRNQIPKLQ